jgi:hypothetical protein
MKQPIQNADAYGYVSPELHVAWHSAQKIVPLLIDMFHPHNVADIGCGIGIWLSAFRKGGVADGHGIDGSWVKPEQLVIPRECFLAGDLNNPKYAVKQLGRKFDMAICLEVAEHLPSQSADELVEALVGLSDLICFSAAIPGQGGYKHINEQWQSYWAQKFLERGFQVFDIIRPQIAGDHKIPFYYRQNVVVYAGPSRIARCVEKSARLLSCSVQPTALDYVVAEHHASRTNPRNYSLSDMARVLPICIWRAVQKRVKQLTANISHER